MHQLAPECETEFPPWRNANWMCVWNIILICIYLSLMSQLVSLPKRRSPFHSSAYIDSIMTLLIKHKKFLSIFASRVERLVLIKFKCIKMFIRRENKYIACLCQFVSRAQLLSTDIERHKQYRTPTPKTRTLGDWTAWEVVRQAYTTNKYLFP